MKHYPITYTCCAINLVPILYILSEVFVVGAVVGLAHNEVLESKQCGYTIWVLLGILIADIITVLLVVCSWSIWQIAFSSYWLNIAAKILAWYLLIVTIIPGGVDHTRGDNATVCSDQPFFDSLATVTYIIVAMSIVMVISMSIISFILAGRAISPVLDSYSEIVLT